MTTLITLISWGWTITYESLKDKQYTFQLMIAGFITHLILGSLTFIGSDMYHKYHDY